MEVGSLVSPAVFGGHITIRHLPRVDLMDVRRGRVFHTADHFRVEKLAFLGEFFDALAA